MYFFYALLCVNVRIMLEDRRSDCMGRKVRSILSEHKLFDKSFYTINYRNGVLDVDASYLVYNITHEYNLPANIVADRLYKILSQCVQTSPNYNREMDEAVTRIAINYNEELTQNVYGTDGNYWNNQDKADDYAFPRSR